jgi:crotonobetainyl-CoA:carnitine CoA-transferase CaiB-like acyl-CoA transferase
MQQSTGPLSGFRIVDLSTVLSGPVATAILADQGADVVKVEAPGAGDLTRHVGARRGGTTAMFHLANRGKRAITIDLSREQGRAVLHRLVASADVVVQNFRPGVVERLGIAYDDLRVVNPELVYLSISGFGFEGPFARTKVYDNLIQAASGFADVQGDGSAPVFVHNLVCDKITAWVSAQAITAALLARARGAGGQQLSLSMLDAAVAFLWVDAGASHTFIGEGVEAARPGGGAVPTRHADGWSTSAAVTDEEFAAQCAAFGHPEVAADPRFATMAGRLTDPDYRRVYREVVLTGAAELTVAEALHRLTDAGVPAAAVVPLSQVPDHPQIVVNGTFVETDDPSIGRRREPRPPVVFSTTPARPGRVAPRRGEHTVELLAELGFTDDDIATLLADGVVAG